MGEVLNFKGPPPPDPINEKTYPDRDVAAQAANSVVEKMVPRILSLLRSYGIEQLDEGPVSQIADCVLLIETLRSMVLGKIGQPHPFQEMAMEIARLELSGSLGSWEDLEISVDLKEPTMSVMMNGEEIVG